MILGGISKGAGRNIHSLIGIAKLTMIDFSYP